jgi:hypothetical protein
MEANRVLGYEGIFPATTMMTRSTPRRNGARRTASSREMELEYES